MKFAGLWRGAVLAFALFSGWLERGAEAETNAAPANTNHLTISFPKELIPVSHGVLEPDAPPLWSREFRGKINGGITPRIQASISAQWEELRAYAAHTRERFILHGGLFLAILILFRRIGRITRERSKAEEGLRPAAEIFKSPALMALLLALFAGYWIYPHPPALWRAILGLATIIPAVVVMRPLIEPTLRPALSLLLVFFLIDQVRRVSAAEAGFTRLLMLGEMLTGTIFFGWMIASKRLAGLTFQLSRIFRVGGGVLVVLFGASFVANVFGCVILATVIGQAILASAYVALVLVALHRIFDAFVASAVNVPPLSGRRMVVENRPFLLQRARHVLGWVAVLFWIYFVLGALSIREMAWQEGRAILAASLQIGSVKFTLGNLASFALTMWIASLVSGAVRFALREEVYPRVTLAPGLQYSISKVVHYAVLIIGLFAALTALGVTLTHLTILASALSVGLGFGLQNIVNNFVSGIILLFERPVKVGDVIVMDGVEGVVTRIGIRASVMRSVNGSEIIIPNGNFISNSVTNWTLSGRHLIIHLALSLSPGTDATVVLALLREAAAANPQILKEPAPEAVLLNLTGGSLNFQLRAWASEDADWQRVRSDLFLAVNAAVSAKNYVIK